MKNPPTDRSALIAIVTVVILFLAAIWWMLGDSNPQKDLTGGLAPAEETGKR